MSMLVRIVLNGLGLWAASQLLPGIHYDGGLLYLLLAGFVLGAVNLLVKPIVTILSLPFVRPDPGPLLPGDQRPDGLAGRLLPRRLPRRQLPVGDGRAASSSRSTTCSCGRSSTRSDPARSGEPASRPGAGATPARA